MTDLGRIFRAFFWMRMRILVNSLERTGARDTLERFSVALEKLGPIVALVLLIPSSIALFVLGTAAGLGAANGDSPIAIMLVRFFLLFVLALTVMGPVILPTRDSGSVIRMLLLPIPRVGLYIAQSSGALADPWILLTVPIVVGVPIGLAAGFKFVAAVVALLAGAAFLLFLLGLTSLASSIVHLLLRDRRRGDMVMLLLVLVIPLIAILPQMFAGETRGPGGRRLTRAERRALPPSPAATATMRLAPYVPSEMYRRSAMGAVASPISSAIPLAELAALALLVQMAGFAAYRRVLDMPVSMGTRRAGSLGGLWDRQLPGLSPSGSAVALTQLRLALRTPRGRASILSPLLVPLALGALASRRGSVPIPGFDNMPGLALAAIGGLSAFLGLLPLALNQFAIDRAGFTRQMLSPIGIRELLTGKAAGNALIAAIPAVFSIVAAAAVLPGGSPLLWLGLVLALGATYALFAPVAAALSAVFPKAVDLNSIGNNSNAHQAAGLLGMLALVVAVLPPAGLTLAAVKWFNRAELVPVLLLGWFAVAVGISVLLFIPVRALVANRCETLAQYY